MTAAAIYSLGHGLCTFTELPRSTAFHPLWNGKMSYQLTDWVLITMAMVDVDGSCQFLAESQPKLIGLVLGFGGHPALILHGGQKTGLFFWELVTLQQLGILHNFKCIEYLCKMHKEYLTSLTPKFYTFFKTQFGNFWHITHLLTTNCYKVINSQNSLFFWPTLYIHQMNRVNSCNDWSWW